ncbi:hypothetical protein D9M72_569070 [compost metagenome]
MKRDDRDQNTEHNADHTRKYGYQNGPEQTDQHQFEIRRNNGEIQAHASALLSALKKISKPRMISETIAMMTM